MTFDDEHHPNRRRGDRDEHAHRRISRVVLVYVVVQVFSFAVLGIVAQRSEEVRDRQASAEAARAQDDAELAQDFARYVCSVSDVRWTALRRNLIQVALQRSPDETQQEYVVRKEQTLSLLRGTIQGDCDRLKFPTTPSPE